MEEGFPSSTVVFLAHLVLSLHKYTSLEAIIFLFIMGEPLVLEPKILQVANGFPTRPGVFASVPQLNYEETQRIQCHFLGERIAGNRNDTLILVEHDSVITLGRTTKDVHWGGQVEALRSQGIQVIEVERGGSATYHGPGQIVGYPILGLRNYCAGPKAYMRKLEEVLIRVLAEWGIEGQRIERYVGVWVCDPNNPDGPLAKIAAMGVKISRGVTMHGFALNASVDLEPFQYIVPCGIEGCRVTSMVEVLGRQPDLKKIREQIAHHFSEVFGIEWTQCLTEISPLS